MTPPLLGLVFAVGCASSERSDVERTLRVLDALRATDPGVLRDEQLKEAESLESRVDVATRARDACVDAYRALANTQQLVASAKGPPVDAAALGAAEVEMDRARVRRGACDAGIAELRRWLKRP